MKCPACEEQIGWDWVEEEGIEPNETFECPECDESLMYKIDESTYFGAQHFTVEIADD